MYLILKGEFTLSDITILEEFDPECFVSPKEIRLDLLDAMVYDVIRLIDELGLEDQTLRVVGHDLVMEIDDEN